MKRALNGLIIGVVVVVFSPGLPSDLLAQDSDVRNVYERLFCVVPMVGAGTFTDPRRPAFVPDHLSDGGSRKSPLLQAPPSDTAVVKKARAPKAIVGFTYQPSDDEQYALVEFWATDRLAFGEILSAAKATAEGGAGPIVKAFELGNSKREDIEQELRNYKKDFDLDSFGGRLR